MSNVRQFRDPAADIEEGGEKPLDLTAVLDTLVRYRWTFIVVAGLITLLGVVYAMLSKPVYRADIVVQVEDTTGNPAGAKLAASLSPVFDVKPAASAEMELLRSRMVVGKAVDLLNLDVVASPRYFPVIGSAIAARASTLSTPGLFGRGGYAWGIESIRMASLAVPPELEGAEIRVTRLEGDAFEVTFPKEDTVAQGKVGTPMTIETRKGTVRMEVSQLVGNPGAVFIVRHIPRGAAIAALQQRLMIAERGKQSGVIGVALEDNSPVQAAKILNAIAQEYVEQNVHRKAEEAEKSLRFLESQMPQLKQQVETAEQRYNSMRNQRGTIDLSEESKLILSQSVAIQTKLQELRTKREELATRFTPSHPSVEIIDSQIASLSGQLGGVTSKIQKLPEVEQNVLRLMRDVKVSTELYQQLLNDTQALKLTKASKVGTARLIDPADIPLDPVRPNRPMISAVAAILGLLAALMAVLLRHVLDGGLVDADEVEQQTGLTVYATIPFSSAQAQLKPSDEAHAGLLATDAPDDPAIESLRTFRTALQFALLNSANRVVVITGPAPGVGKSFVSLNFGAIAAKAGRKVILIDADLRRGSLNHALGRVRTPGLTEILTGATFDSVVQRDVVPGLDFLPTGTQPPLAADLLEHPAMESLLDLLKTRYDLILLDTPPVLAATDATILAKHAGAVFAVARADSTTARELVASQRAMQQAGSDIKGVLFNGLHVEGRWYRPHSLYGKYRYMSQYGRAQSKRA
ncbi:polysaccharide biosynthesis tyrosine autokinase [Cupriavidus agavae]|uniref:Tyrosine-protein kinase Etk/Wzc n=1 Tax=Cupriavidus agavae TaxID=1001822 RepID=A0A4Q7RF65_9BURK|nr:polysaccharide biosynthesis tyrosine autokinase [Cupriavidus agavae]RZT31846.1 tyrosine-protein kinase Etk/Wzc [Cupriavidus agavae]